MNAACLPTPRLQLRWALPTADEADGWSFAPHVPDADGYRTWICHYELVLPLREHDIRREREDGDVSELVISISKTRRGSIKVPDDEPFRDGSHAEWDAPHLGNPPIYVIPFGGSAVLLSDRRAATRAMRNAEHAVRSPIIERP